MAQVTLDVCSLPPAQRHQTIFRSWNELLVGDVLELINDHDPLPLFYQFQAEHSNQFTWTYVDRGPTWRVHIARTAA